jgi:hypothetical protein
MKEPDRARVAIGQWREKQQQESYSHGNRDQIPALTHVSTKATYNGYHGNRDKDRWQVAARQDQPRHVVQEKNRSNANRKQLVLHFTRVY